MPATAHIPGSALTVGGTSAQLVAARTGRRQLFITNNHATQDVYLSLGGTAVLNGGIFLRHDGGAFTLTVDAGANDVYNGAINAIATGAGTTVGVSEV